MQTKTNLSKIDSKLFAAVKEQKPLEIKSLIKKGAHLAAKNENNKTPIELACDLGFWDIVELIAKSKATNATDTYCYGSALLAAVVKNRFETVQCLLEAKSSLGWYTKANKFHILHYSVTQNNQEMTKLLLENNANLAAVNSDNRTPMQLASDLGFWDIVELIAKSKAPDYTDTYCYGYALLTAVEKNRFETVQCLLKAKSSLRWQTTATKFTSLHYSVKQNNTEMTKLLLENNADLAAVNSDNRTPIQLASDLGYWDIVELIAKSKATNATDTYCYGYALLTAVEKNRFDTVQCLLKAQSSLRWQTTATKFTSLHYSVTQNNIGMTALLLENNANLAAVNSDNKTPMQLACDLGYWDIVELIAKSKATNATDTYCYGSALFVAVQKKRFETVQYLLKANSSLTWRTTPNNFSCFHEAVNQNNLAILGLLVKYDTSFLQHNLATQTPLELACSLGHWECADVLIQNKIVRFTNDYTAGVAYIDAIKSEQLHIATLLLKKGAPATGQTKPDGNTALHWVVMQWNTLPNNSNTLRFVIKQGAKPKTVNNGDKTPIELAIELGHWDCVQMLIELNPNANYGKNALIKAIKKHNYAITKLLLDNGSSCNSWNSDMGNISLYWAIKENQPEIVDLLLAHGANPCIKNAKAIDTFGLAEQLGHEECFQHLQASKFKRPFKAIALPKPPIIVQENITKVRNEAGELFQALLDNAIKPQDLPGSILKLNSLHQSILEFDRSVLIENRKKLQSNNSEQTPYNTQSLDTNSELGKLNTIIQTVNTLINSSNQQLQLGELNSNSAEERDMQIYLTYKQTLENYALRVHIFLTETKLEIKRNPWKIKSFLGFESDGKPEPIQQLETELAKLSNMSQTDNILLTYINVIGLMTQLDLTHEKTNQFYANVSKQITNLTFISLPVTLTHTIQQTQSMEQSYCSTQDVPQNRFFQNNSLLKSSTAHSGYDPIYPYDVDTRVSNSKDTVCQLSHSISLI